ncbi:MAG TPA: aspartate/glutamate racemase family protein [Candidatus Lustribacter sp.]|nr:aspartate/glutamate racemase family protein [Candidatus Lustribacter sp.]
MIGVYDSGLGGLTVLAALRAAGIDDDVVYFADQAHAPYGERTDADLHALMTANLGWLQAHGADLVVMGCNTSCAVAGRLGWPPLAFPLPIQDLIVNGARAFAGATFRRVAVVATPATVRSHAYSVAIGAVAPNVEVVEIAAPLLVPLVEAGESESERARAAVRDVVAAFPPGVDALVYGCTHYPLLEAHFAAALPAAVRIDPAREQARAVRALRLPPGGGTTLYVTNGDVARFESNVRKWTGDRTGRVTGLVEPALSRVEGR